MSRIEPGVRNWPTPARNRSRLKARLPRITPIGALALSAPFLPGLLRADGQASASSSGSAQTLQANIGLLQFVIQSTLSAQERQEVANDVGMSLKKTPPQKIAHVNQLISITLTNAARYPKDAPRLRELWRYDIAANVAHNDVE